MFPEQQSILHPSKSCINIVIQSQVSYFCISDVVPYIVQIIVVLVRNIVCANDRHERTLDVLCGVGLGVDRSHIKTSRLEKHEIMPSSIQKFDSIHELDKQILRSNDIPFLFLELEDNIVQ